MFNKFFNIFRFCIGFRLLCLCACLVLVIVTFYQLILTLFIPCFANVAISLIEFCTLICLIFYTIFGY